MWRVKNIVNDGEVTDELSQISYTDAKTMMMLMKLVKNAINN